MITQLVVVLSAKNKEQLYKQVQNLEVAIEKQKLTDSDLMNICYTLQIGREHMEYRAAFLVNSMQELQEKLKAYISGQEDGPDIYSGNSAEENDFFVSLGKEDELKSAINNLMLHKKYEKVLELWVKGIDIDWAQLYEEEGIKTEFISLPTYPFAREKYWAPEKIVAQQKDVEKELIHPLVHENISNLKRQCFCSKFKENTTYVKDHKLNELTYLEMARVAAQVSLEETEFRPFQIKDVLWYDAILVDEVLQQVNIALYPNEHQEIEWEVYGQSKASRELIVSGEGKITYEAPTMKTLQWEQIVAACEEISDVQLPDGIEKIYKYQDDSETQLVIKFKATNDTNQEYGKQLVIDPIKLSACIEVVSQYLGTACNKNLKMSNLSVETVDEWNWGVIYVEKCQDIQHINVGICDEEGNVTLQIEDLQCIQEALGVQEAKVYEEMIFEEKWCQEKLKQGSLSFKKLLVFLSDTERQNQFTAFINEVSPETKLVFGNKFELQNEQVADIDGTLYLEPLEKNDYMASSREIFTLIQELNKNEIKPKKLLIAATYKDRLTRCYVESWIGIQKSMGMVMPNTCFSLVCIDETQNTDTNFAEKVWQEAINAQSETACYENGLRQVRKIQEVKLVPNEKSTLKQNGVYIITGGTGGLGVIFSNYLISKYQAKLVLVSRSKKEIYDERVRKLQMQGAEVIHLQADVCNIEQMKEVIRVTKEQFGHINGIIHAAGMESTKNILEKDFTEYENIIASKIQGTLTLEEACKDEALDFICYFSSSAAIIGDFANCDYSVGNRFLMSYAEQFKDKPRYVINWPLWKSEGMGFADQNSTQMYLKSSGQCFIEAKQGTVLFDEFLRQPTGQHLVIIGEKERVYRFLKINETTTAPVLKKKPIQKISKAKRTKKKGLDLVKNIQLDLKDMIVQVLNVPKEKIYLNVSLDEFGFDSISLTELSYVMSNYYEFEITPDIFFAYPTVEKLSEYLSKKYKEKLESFYHEEEKSEAVEETEEVTVEETSHDVKGKRIRQVPIVRGSGRSTEDIAIIGISGRFPDAYNVEELWSILEEGREVIKEMPKERQEWWHQKQNNYKYRLGVVPGIAEFDPLFFGISPREAEDMDPRQRLLLQETWKALEDAGYGSDNLKDEKIGMFVGTEDGDYKSLLDYKANITANSNAVLASRISYLLNLDGPNMAINTACSSGLVGVHEACMSIRNGECDTAIVAGVNLMVTPDNYNSMIESGMIAKDGHCYAFDKRANGMMPAEAVAVVILKKLSKAEKDHNPIYGTIIGSGINYDGKTNGITAPSRYAQSKLLKEVYNNFKIAPRNISYIVTHGTGTRLGDPIEINALADTFEEYTKDTKFCAITSTKSNLGHALAASGVVSLISLIMAIKKGIIPPSIHCEEPNDYIQWEDSPFYINTKASKWEDSEEQERIGAVSAFGMSGTNVHVVVKSNSKYGESRNKMVQAIQCPAYLLAFSAKTEQALIRKANELADLIENHPNEQSLAEISYTLMDGRIQFNHRCAFVVENKEDAIKALRDFSNDRDTAKGFKGIVERDFTPQETITQSIEALIKRLDLQVANKYYEALEALAKFYCMGYKISSTQLFGSNIPYKVSLPTYPFEKEVYWAEAKNVMSQGVVISQQLHPLLHRNTSDLVEQRYTSVFNGEEFFLRDHVVNGNKVLPGVAYLEMIRAAVQQATTNDLTNFVPIKISNVGWFQPIAVQNTNKEVNIALYEDKDNELSYEIYTEDDSIHSQGKANVIQEVNNEVRNFDELKARCSQLISNKQCYDAFRKMKMNYGITYTSIQEVYVGKGEAFAKIAIPESLVDTNKTYVLHPSLLDGALQSIIGLGISSDEGQQTPRVPFAMESLEIYKPADETMWAVIKDNSTSDRVLKHDIDLCNEAGEVCIRIKGYTSRVLNENSLAAKVQLMAINWQEQSLETRAATNEMTNYYVAFCGINHLIEDKVYAALGANVPSQSMMLDRQGEIADHAIEAYSLQLFDKIKEILLDKSIQKACMQVVVVHSGSDKIETALNGMLKTAQQENPKLMTQLIEIDAQLNDEEIVRLLKACSQDLKQQHIRYIADKSYVPTWQSLSIKPKEVAPWKDEGVYLITGGLGGLGIIFANEIVSRAKQATIILTGRKSEEDQKVKDQLMALKQSNPHIYYWQMDVCNKESVEATINRIIEQFGKLNGVIHSAGIIKDGYIINKSKDEFKQVLQPKMSGIVNLDYATQNIRLDLFVAFSSVTGTLGNPGQVDYAIANSFMNQYAGYRNRLVNEGKRFGQTLAISWPLWKNGGMHIDAQTEKLLEQTVGVTSIETKEGIEAFYNAWSLNKASIICLAGDFKKIKASVENKASNPKKEEGVEVTTKEGITIEQVAHYLKGILSQDIKLPVQRIDSDAGMEEYGIDSLMVMQLTSHLEEIFGALPKTLFFEYQTVRELSGYFLKEHKETLSKLLNVAATKKTPPVKEMQGKEESVSEVKGSKRGNRHRRYVANHYDIGPNENEDIAIVGMAGKYPKSDNLKEYWDNLRNGVDCITEIPKERWDGDLLFDPDKNKQGSIYCKWGGFINGVNEFDPLFFNIAPREAEIMEPQERLFLQCVYHTLEDAGYTPQQVRNLQKGNSGVGVYVGVMYEEYQLYGAQHQMKGHQIALSGNPSSIANRISYYCNFNGPSMAIDTMCSSSLTAVHLACRSILQGECEAAIAGGVNVSVHPNKYVMLSQGKFASSKGRCESFGEGGDGYVPGEGVGAIMLKKLSKAVEDGDHIYGVIKATTINHGGRTNGYTVPNPNAQRNLISKALYEAHIDPRTISYIEAHGTGTSLGDPIEITGLSQAFGEYTKDKQFCAIGSAKSNIGHCESAAGIAGITKVLLQMKYKEIVPSIHSKILNPYIDFEKTPFVVQQELTPWKKPIIKENGKDVEYPRRAGISAFGAGGSNAHIIIEEYEDNKEVKTNQLDEFVIILSAKTEEQLNQKVQDLRNEIDKYSNEDLMNIAYTLQVGREDMEYRLAFTTSNVAEVKEKLTKFINNDLSADVIYTGRAKKNSSSLKKIMNDEDMKNAIETWIIKRKYDKLISLWLKGIKIDWRKMYVGAAPQKISLPTYPFAKEVYWVPKGERQNGTLSSRQSTIHPFISENTSNFMTQKFTTHFDRQQAYLEDKGAYSIVPLVVQLEMARIASKLSMETVDGKAVLHNIHIYKPIEVTDVFNQLDTKLYIESDGDIAWELYSQSDESGDTLCCEGRTSYVIDSEDEVLDLKQSHYIQFNVANKTIWVNEIQEGEGKIFIEFNQEANEALQGYKEQVVIEPTMYKECMQSIGEYLGIMMQTEFIESIVINKESSSHSVLVEFNLGQSNLDLNMTWYDHEKHVTTKMIGMQCTINEEVSDKSKQALVPEESAIYETMAFTEEWQETEAVMGNDLVKRIVIFVESLEYKQNISNELMVYEEDIQLIFVAPGEKYHKYAEDEYEIAAHKKEDYIQCLETVQNKWPQVDSIMYLWALNNKQYAIDETEIIYTLQALAKSKLDAKRLLIVGGYSDEITRCHIESWIGIERSIKMVLPAVKVNVVCMRNEDLSWHKCINLLYKELRSKEESVWFDHNIRKTCHLREVQLENEVQHMLKKQGVYIITGGLGGLGKMFAKYLMTTYDAKLALIGRSKEESRKAQLDELRSISPKVMYIQADVSQIEEVENAFELINAKFGNVNGIIHAAGLDDPGSILTKDMADYKKTIAPKVQGILAIEAASQTQDLDFICYFSSSSAIIGDFGNCDYAVGNRFLMSHGKYYNDKASREGRKTKAIVINWPLWKSDGMGFGSEDGSKMYLKTSGQRFMEEAEGIALFEKLLNAAHHQHLVIIGERERVYRFLGLKSAKAESKEQKVINIEVKNGSNNKGRKLQMQGLSIEACVQWDLKEQISQILKIPQEKLDIDENLADFGFDSITLGQFADSISDYYEIKFTPDMLYSYPTVEKLSQYFMTNQKEKMNAFYAEDVKDEVNHEVEKVVAPKAMIKKSYKKEQKTDTFRLSRFMNNTGRREKVAIIGISGRFPGARDVNEFWNILLEGKEVIGEVPRDRQSWWQQEDIAREARVGAIPGVAEFDPLFFEISPVDAEEIDPRQRLLLEETWKALEDAGYDKKAFENEKIGIFVGVEDGDYRLLAGTDSSITSNHNAVLAARLSYFLNLKGPNMAINTACSSGLVAFHQACLSLQNDECDTAIVAAANLMTTPEGYKGMKAAGMLGKDGKCYAFDKRANGMIPSEAIAVIILKKGSKAQLDGNHIYATVAGSGVNYDGKTNGITAPSGQSQTRLLKEVYEKAHINPEDISYIVTHGTGTKLGDPMEINALADAFKEYQTSKAHCAITSNKPNIGHALAASGLVSLISLIMAFKTKTIPASINCEQVNDYIHWEESPFYINRANKVWKGEDGKKRLAGVSAFGMSGTNAHVVLESYDKASHAVPELSYVMLVLSAKTKEALKQRIEDLIAWLEKEDIQLERVSYTLMAGRMHFNHRLAVVVKNRQEAIEVLKKAIDSESVPNVFKGTVQRGIVTLDTVKESMLQMIEANNRLDVDAYQKILCTLSENYCKGYEVPYEKLFNGIQEKVSLPTYPFARETYWVEAKETNLGVRQLHPFIHENVSNLSQQCFKTTLMSKEQLMQSIYLEMARKALMLSKEEQDKVLVLEHITFPERLDTNEEACELYTRIYESGRSLNWEISKDKQLTRDETVYCTGKAVYRRNEALEKADLEAQVNDCQKMALTIPKIHSTWTSDGANQVIVEFEQENNLDIIISPQIIVGGLKALQEIHHKKWHVVDIKKINKIEILSLSPSKWGILTINNQEAELTVDMKLYDEAGNMTLHIYDLQCGDVMQLQEVATPKKRRMKKQVTGKGRCLEMKGFTIEQCIIWEIKNMITKMLKIPTEKLDLDESLSEFGFDSISLLKFADHINERYEINITPDTFYTYPTIERLKDYLYKQYTDKMQEFYQDEFVIVEEEKEIMPQKDKKTLRRSVQPQEEIAIVGMSGRFPDAWNVDELWTILSQGKEVIHDIDKSRKEWWQAPIVSRNVGAIPGIDEFDALFFGISPREAENMDPRQRILLEEMWKALEDAGYGEKALKNEKIGIFAGIEESDYRVLVGKNANITANHNGVLAARLAYFLNLKGPNMAINTACSSGLVALHEACLSLRNGECDTAIVAAANIMSTPESYDAMKEAGMLSKSGKCYAFDKRADGMIPAEAIAVVVLKRLSYAKENHHPIYASIVADGINYDGKTNGITAPSGQAQIELLKDTYEKFDINPQDISYMVTHGTGTKLGDPIEINALSEVFKAYNMPNKCCALTSTKPNIGHALAASGVVSLISLVMALNKEAIPASINCEQVNDYIHWEESPFYINQKLKPWSDTNGVKRLGAVSAFGMSGTNVHVVVESYHDVKEVCEPKSNYLLVFSAKTEDSLYNNISNMITTFERNKTLDLSEVSYTLLTGRMSFNHRCSVVVRDIDEAINVLKQVHSGKKLPNLFEGVVPRDFVGHAFIQEAIENVLKQIDSVENDSMKYQSALTALAEFYCMGYNVPSEALFKNDTPQLINLPTYAFEREHYWAEESCSKVHSNDTQASVLHPLVHSNTSEFTMQRFSSIFTGNESCFEDGFMKELAYIEMVQVGMALSLGEQRSTMEIRNIVWNDKLSSQVSDVHIGFGLDEAQEMYFKVYAQDNVENPNSIGYVNATEVATIEQVELNEIIKAYPESLKVDKVYAGIEEILQGQEGLMVKLKDSLSTNVYRADAIINVDILESCLSAIKIAYGIENASIKLKTATEMSIKINECITWAILTVAQEEQAGKTVFVVDADLCDRDGNVTAYIEELVFEIEGFKKVESPKEVKGAEAIYETMAFKEDWEEKTLEMVEKEIRNIVVYADIAHWSEITQYIKAQNEATRLILITQGEAYAQEDANKYSINKDKLEDHIQVLSRIKEAVGELDNILYLWAKENEAEARSQTSIVYILQAIHQTATSVKQVTLVGGDEDELIQCYEESWMGITFSTKLVLPKVKIHTAYIKASDMNKYLPVVWQELFAEKIENVYYENNIRKVLKKQEVKLEDKSESMFKNDGIYLLTGGLGGLGMIFSMHLAETYDANLILVGRSKQEKYQDRIDRIKKAGANVLYVQADVCNLEQMQQAVQKGVEAFGKINGVIHAAGLPGKGNILEKDIKEYYATMAPKIQGTLVLTKACQEQQLDFICYFSSSSAIIGDFGNCDYAVGNRFLMSYARYYNSKVGKEGYTGKAVVVNWPLWKSEGMGFQDEQGSKMYLKSSGQKFMEAAEGIPLLEKLLVQTRLQHLILIGERDRVYRFLQLEKKGVDEVIIAETKKTIKKPGKGRKREMKGWSVSQCITWDLKEAISKLLKLPISKIEVNENLADFGFDSMTLEEFSDILSKKYQLVINPDVFYRYPTIEKLCEYLNNEYHKVLEEYYQEEEKKVVTVNKKEQPIAHTVYEAKKVERSIPEKQFIAPSQVEIAVVGMSGRFPDSRNVEELWAILSEGKDVVHNVSKERTQWWEDNKDRKIGSIPGVAEFDSLFFEISPREAETMDPRQRLLLQETWKALEDAGYGERLLKEEKIGMFVGVEEGDYKALVGTEGSITSNHNGVLAARLAYFLNLDGPNMAINTACSSGLVAVHEACLSLRSGECDTAIVAAANIMALATTYDCMDQVGMLGKDGKCYAFDKRAEGMIPAEAVAVIVLKRLDKAKQDGNPIYGTIVGSGINYDGRTNGITAPSGEAQVKLLKDVYKRFNVNPEDMSYIVTHGTGTKLGDPIEINALAEVFKGYVAHKKNYCALTSTKPNIGHALAASGVVSLISLLLAMKYETIPQSIHCEQPNDYIDWEQSPFYLNRKNKVWKDEANKARLAAVSAFGMSGTNAHVVVKSYRDEACKCINEMPAYLFAFSARNTEILQECIHNMRVMLEESKEELNLAQISYTLLNGRKHFNERCVVVVRSREEAVWVLRQAEESVKVQNIFRGSVSRDFTVQTTMQRIIKELIRESHECVNDEQLYFDKICALAEFYCLGHEIPAKELFGEQLNMVSLPTYPFAKKKHWVGMRTKNKPAITNKPVVESEPVRTPKPVVAPKSVATKPVSEKTVTPQMSEKVPMQARENKIVLRDLSEYLNNETYVPDEVRELITLEPLGGEALNHSVQAESKKPIAPQKRSEVQKGVEVSELLQDLTVSLAKELYVDIEEIESDKSFTELGLDSIIGVEWIREINKKYGLNISSTRIYQYPNLLEFTKYIAQSLNKVSNVAGQIESVSQVTQNVRKEEKVTPKAIEEEHPSINMDEIIVDLASSLAEELYIDLEDIDYEKSFMELGLDSIIGVEWVKHINKKYGVNINSTRIYEYPNLIEFAKYIASNIKKTEVSNVQEVKSVKPSKTKTSVNMEEILSDLANSLAQELYVDVEEIDYGTGFTELGLDSIIGVEWIRGINKKYKTNISTTKIYQYSNLSEFAKYIVSILGDVQEEKAEKEIEQKEDIDIDQLLWQVYEGDAEVSDTEKLISDYQRGNEKWN